MRQLSQEQAAVGLLPHSPLFSLLEVHETHTQTGISLLSVSFVQAFVALLLFTGADFPHF